jgi:pyruvate/2-oxoglutarate dehydrogenase complex dihydrolipoamide dehydrogenase (E3) component
VTIKSESEEEEILDFAFLTLCTGATFDDPVNTEGVITLDDRHSVFEEYREKVEEANSILIVGAGATGLETLGELEIKYGTKKRIGLYNRGPNLLSAYNPKAQRVMKGYFENSNAELHLDQGEFDPGSDLVKEYDVVIKCIGSKQNSQYM